MWYKATSASVSSGGTIVQINSGNDISIVQESSGLIFENNSPVEVKKGYTDGSGNSFIELVDPWPYSTVTNQPLVVYPTDADFAAATVELRSVIASLSIATTTEAEAGTSSTKLMTPATTVSAIDKQLEVKAEWLNGKNPYPWAMRKVEFEAIRAANEEEYAANGFVHLGKHRKSGGSWEHVNEGLSTSLTIPNTMRLGWAQSDIDNAEGWSKQLEAVINIAGTLSTLSQLQNINIGIAEIKLPPAEDGTRTYDSSTGVSVTHATPALAFAAETTTNKVVTDRVDMWGFEAFLREINDVDPFVYKNGLIQSLASDINGVVTVSDNVRPITYFAWYEGDTTSRGKGVNWQTATEAQRIAIASDPKNNIYFDDATGKFYQWCVRGRSFAGAGNGDWSKIDTTIYSELMNSEAVQTRIMAQGVLDSTTAYGSGMPYISYLSGYDFFVNQHNDPAIYYLRNVAANQDVAVNGECYFLVCDTVERLNRGAYHPSFNSLGTAKLRLDTGVGGAKLWHESGAKSPSNKADCFSFGDDLTVGDVAPFVGNNWGSLVAGTTLIGRPDGRYYDAIYASGQGGVCRDMRYSAHKLTAEDFAEQDLKIKSGEYRGREVLLKTKFIPETVTVGGAATYNATNAGGTVSFTTSDSDNPKDQDSPEFSELGATYWLLAGDNGATMVIKRVSLQGTSIKWPYSNNIVYLYGSGDVTNEFNSKFPAGTKLWVGAMYPVGMSVADEFTHTEVIGAPSEIILCDDLKDGWVGSWNPTIPNNQITKVSWDRPVIETPSSGSVLYTLNSGESWGVGSSSIWLPANPENESSTVELTAGMIVIASYKTKARMTISTTNSKVYGAKIGVGDVFVSESYRALDGALLNFSLTGNISTHLPNTFKVGVENKALLSSSLTPSFSKLWGSPSAGENVHAPISLTAPTNDSPAFKALNYNAVKNQQGFINYAYAQLTYDDTAGDWGDDSKIHIVDNQSTMLDENGNLNLVGTAQSVEPIGWIKNDK